MTKKMTAVFCRATFPTLLAVTFSAPPLLAADEPAAAEGDPQSLYFDQGATEQTTTRAAKPLSQVAENVSIITAEEIERMNAHSVAEVLNRVPGFLVQFNGRDFNGSEGFYPQDADMQHVLVLVDGMRWNDIVSGMAVTNAIPIEIISRIEVIKGPASSTWGSALGGVVNIITKKTGVSERPGGALSASYGEANSQEYSATVAGKTGPAGYFIAAGSQSSDGLMGNRFYDRENVFAKVNIDLPHASTLTLTSGYSEPEMRYYDSYTYGLRIEGTDRNFWGTASLDSSLTDNINFNATVSRNAQKHIRPYYTLPNKALWYEYYQDNWTNGANAMLNGHFGPHQLVAGAEFERSESENQSNATFYDEVWAAYLNDTYSVGAFTITPGIRYDHLSLSDDFTSPSLGLTWQFAGQSLLRAVAARGFKRPYIDDVNWSVPGLEPERITSYQFGLETANLVSLGMVKATVFEHHLKDTWLWDAASNWLTYNAGDTKRYGYELEIDTVSFYHLSAQASFTYTYIDYYGRSDNDDQYCGKLTMLYDDPALLTIELFGSYTWWNEQRINASADFGTMIWDLNVSRELQTGGQTSIRLFAAVHNLFDGRDYQAIAYENPHRWVEAGLRFNF
jgi:vitamin B12 transporter